MDRDKINRHLKILLTAVPVMLLFLAALSGCTRKSEPAAAKSTAQETAAPSSAETSASAAESVPASEEAITTAPAKKDNAQETPVLLSERAGGEDLLKRNQEAGYFLFHDGKVYYRLPGEEAMRKVALFGEYMSSDCGPSEIRYWDPASGKSEKLCESSGWGKMYLLDDCIVAREKEGLVKITFDRSREPLPEVPADGIMAVFDHYIIYEKDDYNRREFRVFCRDLDSGTDTDLGRLDVFEDASYPGELQQFYADGSSIWFTMAQYEGTGHFYYHGKLYHADITVSSSLSSHSIGGIEPLPEAVLPEDLTAKFNRAPGFVVRKGVPFTTAGEPGTAEIDYESGELVYYDNIGNCVPAGSGYETFLSEEEDTRVHIELAEYTGNKIFLIRNEEWHDSAKDVGWREAYLRKFTYIVMADPLTGEETIIDAAACPVDTK